MPLVPPINSKKKENPRLAYCDFKPGKQETLPMSGNMQPLISPSLDRRCRVTRPLLHQFLLRSATGFLPFDFSRRAFASIIGNAHATNDSPDRSQASRISCQSESDTLPNLRPGSALYAPRSVGGRPRFGFADCLLPQFGHVYFFFTLPANANVRSHWHVINGLFVIWSHPSHLPATSHSSRVVPQPPQYSLCMFSARMNVGIT